MRRWLAGLLVAAASLCAPPTALAKEDPATVLRVIDGDTIEVDIVGQTEKVRLIAVDTPETVHPNKPVEAFGKEASEFTRKLLEGKQVVLRDELGGQDRDKYGRLLRYVYLEDGTFVNAEIIKQGYGHAPVPAHSSNMLESRSYMGQGQEISSELRSREASRAEPVRTPAPSQGKPDFSGIARKIVHDSAQVKEKDKVLIIGDPSKVALMEEIAVEVAKAGAFPYLVLDSPAVVKWIVTEAPLEYRETPNPMVFAEWKKADVVIRLSEVEGPVAIAQVPEERVALGRKTSQANIDVIYTRPIRTVTLGNPSMPTPALARFYDVPMAEIETRFWVALDTPHAAIEETGTKVKQALASGREVQIRTQAGTDLSFRLAEGRKITLNDGRIHEAPVAGLLQVFLPAGEVYTTPDATSVNGTAVVPLADYRGIKIKNLRLTFENGRVTRIDAAQNAEVLKEALARSTGDKDVFSFLDIGVNPNSHPIRGSDYSTYEMAGMVTIGIGQAPWTDSPNKSDFGQDFFVPRATLEVDGRIVVRDGKLQTQTPPRPGSGVGLVDEALHELDWGSIAFNAPPTMRYKKPYLIELLLSPSLSVAKLQAQLEQKVGAESARVRISNRMEAQLTGSGFEIAALLPDLLAITSEQTSRWRWEVTPTNHGRQRLHLALSAHIDVAGRDAPLVVRTFDRTIEVEITMPQRVSGFIQKNWQWLWAAVFVPIAGYLWRRWKKRPDEAKRVSGRGRR